MPDKIEEWLIQHPLVGVLLMALLGGFLAHLKAMAAELPTGDISFVYRANFALKCLLALAVRMIGAALGGLVVLFAWRGLGWPWEYGFIAAGVIGLFSTEFFEWLFIQGKAWVAVRVGVKTQEKGD
jgi:hypothetical protein